jgi:hypothetical protein
LLDAEGLSDLQDIPAVGGLNDANLVIPVEIPGSKDIRNVSRHKASSLNILHNSLPRLPGVTRRARHFHAFPIDAALPRLPVVAGFRVKMTPGQNDSAGNSVGKMTRSGFCHWYPMEQNENQK